MGAPEDTRTRILRVGAELFAARGYHGTGLAELLQAVGVARGGFYHHFRSKEDVLLEIVARTIDGILLSSAKIVGQSLDAATKLRMLCDDLSTAIIDNQAGFIVLLREYSALNHDAKEKVLALRRIYLQRWEGVLAEGARTGLFAARETPYTEGVLGMWIYSFVWNRGSVKPETIARDLADFVLRGVRGDIPLPTTIAGRPNAARSTGATSRRPADRGGTSSPNLIPAALQRGPS